MKNGSAQNNKQNENDQFFFAKLMTNREQNPTEQLKAGKKETTILTL